MEENKRIKQLEESIIKRNELIFSMIHNTHQYINFMTDKSIDIDKLYKIYNTENVIKSKHASDRIKLLNNDIKIT